jgi:DNA-binding MarR family transcriptional regulator
VPERTLTDAGRGGDARPAGGEPDRDVVSRLRMAVTRLARLLRQQADGDATPSQLAALATVTRLGPLTLGELAAIERVRPPSMTRIVGALEEAGLVVREGDPGDRRVARVRVSDAGLAFTQRTRNQRDAWLAERIAMLRPSERRDVARAVAVIERLIDPDPQRRSGPPRPEAGPGIGP